MRDTSILMPVFALAAWTGLILAFTAVRRLTAGLSPKEFALGESSKVPPEVSLPNRNYMNLLELPVLFYVICIVAFSAQSSSPFAIFLAWSYVATRVAHSAIHITYNKVLHRLTVFVLSNFVLITLWVVVGLAVLGDSAA